MKNIQKDGIYISLNFNGVFVVVQNASHKAWGRAGGRLFTDFTAAKAAYKSKKVISAIEYAERILGASQAPQLITNDQQR
jgi:hypothetical protein